MVTYDIFKSKYNISVRGKCGEITKEDIDNLWEKHKILYIGGNIMAVWIEPRIGMNPIVHLMGEDDGHIFWDKDSDVSFDCSFLDDYIQTLTKLKTLL